jgi:hypothetical protein
MGDDNETFGSGLPGDTHVDPEPFKGMGLSKNPHPKISPQTMPATLERPYVAPVEASSPNPRHQAKHSKALRDLVKRED